jgi:2-hydroxy-3-keto-5-methylthiopentenyl-1-phosphate phosphatase
MRAYMSHAPEDADQLERLMEQTRPDPQFAETVHRLTRSGWEVVVASAGSSWYIERILARAGVAGLPIHANRGSIQHGRGLWMELPVDSPFFSPEVGIDKAAIVRDAISRAEVAAFAGDGPLDLGPAMLVKLEFRFARGWLARELARLGEPFTECRRWADIAVALSDAGHLE